MPKIIDKIKTFLTKTEILSINDLIIMGALCLFFTIIVFARLGNTYAPQSGYESTFENRDIIIDFGQYVEISKLQIYHGNLDNRKLALSAFNEVTGEWEIIADEVNIPSVFAWNSVDIYYNLRYLGIVSYDEEAVFMEFVFLDNEGQVITPVNISDYPELFDEQEYFYNTAESTYMDGTMFDEVYHGRTGYEFVHGLPTYETTHPQLGKCIIALGIRLFGMTPFGMRFFSALFGIAFIPLMYIFAKRLFENTFVAACVGIFITYDCMHYTLSRIGTIDIFVAFFIVASYYYMYRYILADNAYRVAPTFDRFCPRKVWMPLAMSGITLGLAVATKLTGVYAGLGLAVILIVHTLRKPPRKQTFRLFWFCFGFFIVFPLAVYTLAYIPTVEKYAQMGLTDRSIEWTKAGLSIGYGYTGLLARTLRNTSYMINYHKDLVATHYYESPFYEWPVVWMPLLAANDSFDGADRVSAVSYMGNIAIWWMQIPCIVFTLIMGIRGLVNLIVDAITKQSRKVEILPMFLSVAYLAQYIPWMEVSRITFIYHYLPSAIFGMLIMGYAIASLIKRWPKARVGVYAYLGIVIIVFWMFFPVISGWPISKDYGMWLRFLPDWILVL